MSKQGCRTVVLAFLAVFLAGCGAGEEPQAVVTVTAPPADAGTAPPEASLASETAPLAQELPPAPVVAQGVVPAVVGLDHQLAQDTMQAAGFYNLTEEDATGQGRALVFDRNWVVVEQQPEGGTSASADVTVILRSKKIGE